MKIYALLKNPVFERCHELFPLEEWQRIYTLEELYQSTLEEYDILLIDYTYVLHKEIGGLDEFIHAFENPKVFGVQQLPNQSVSFLYLNPIERIPMEQFLEQRPWTILDRPHRQHHRFGCPLCCEITQNSDQKGCRTFLDQLSLKGALIHGHYANGSTIFISLPTEEQAQPLTLKAQIKWAAPWGKIGIIPQCGIEFRLESEQVERLKRLLKEKIIPYYLSQRTPPIS